jgi:hypothetical protein
MKRKLRITGTLPNGESVVLGYSNSAKKLTDIIKEYTEVFPGIAFTIKSVKMIPADKAYAIGKILSTLMSPLPKLFEPLMSN